MGLNAPLLEEKLGEALTKYLIDPVVFVTIKEYNSHRVIALGETTTGMYTLKRKTTLLEFLGQIGGPTDNADVAHIKLIKKDLKDRDASPGKEYPPSSDIKQIILTDGSDYVGIIEKEEAGIVFFRAQSGIHLQIPKQQVKKISNVKPIEIDGQYVRADPNQTRLFFAPTARPLKAGQGYFAVYEIMFPMLAVGMTDFLAISGGMSLVPGAEQQVFYIAPKLTLINQEHFALGSGILYMSVTDKTMGIAYGVSTYSSGNFGITCGLGWGFVDGDFSEQPMLTIGLELQGSNSVKIISENWFFPESGNLLSCGIRFFGSSLAADFAMVTSSDILRDGEGWPFIPWIGFAYNF